MAGVWGLSPPLTLRSDYDDHCPRWWQYRLAAGLDRRDLGDVGKPASDWTSECPPLLLQPEQMIILTTEMLDRVETIRGAAISSIRASALPEELQIDIRQGINQSIDATVQSLLKAASGQPPVTNLTSPGVQF